MTNWYISNSGWTSKTAWSAAASISAGTIRRQTGTPTVGNERLFIATSGGTTGGSEPAWTLTKGAIVTDNSVVWQEITGLPGVNGDIAGTLDWNAVKNTAVALGTIIKNVSGTTLFIATVAGTAGNGSEPSWNILAGNSTTDNTITWVSLGAASGFPAFGAPHARLANAYANSWGAAGDTFFLSNTHSETQSSNLALANPGTTASPCRVLSINPSSVVTPVLTSGATIQVTGVATLSFGGIFYCYGVTVDFNSTFVPLSSANTNNNMFFESCTFNFSGTANNAWANWPGGVAPQAGEVTFKSCTFIFGQTSTVLHTVNGLATYISCSFAASGTIPTALFQSDNGGRTIVRDCDLSNISTNLVNATSQYGTIDFFNCRLSSSVSVYSGVLTSRGSTRIRLHNCDNGGTNYKFTETTASGTSSSEISIVRTGGASDGTTQQSIKIISSATSSQQFPFEVLPVVQWNNTVNTPVSATIEIASNNTLTNADIWMEVEYLGSASSPIGSVASNGQTSVLATATNLPTSSAVWGGGLSSKQSLSVTFTPRLAGPVVARIFVAKKSQTLYIDPYITLV